MNKKIILRGLLGSILFVSLQAGYASPILLKNSINAIQAEHQRKIADGYRSGALSLQEKTILLNQQKRIESIEARFRKNGLQAAERRQLLALLRWAERTIEAKLTNSERGTVQPLPNLPR